MQLQNLNIKASNGTTDVVYKANTPQNGDYPASWFISDETKPRADWPKLTTKVRPAKGGASTHVDVVMNMPFITTSNGVQTRRYATFSGTMVVSNTIPPIELKEFYNNVSKIVATQFLEHCKTLEPAV